MFEARLLLGPRRPPAPPMSTTTTTTTTTTERFAAEQRRHWEPPQSSRKHSLSQPMDPRSKMRPEGKPYLKNDGVFRDIVGLLPLEDGDEIETFRSRLRRFTKSHGPLAISQTRDNDGRPLIWFAVDANDPIACELLLGQGAASSAFAKIHGGKSPFEHAYAKRYERVVRALNGWAHSELADVRTGDVYHHQDDDDAFDPIKLLACECAPCTTRSCPSLSSSSSSGWSISAFCDSLCSPYCPIVLKSHELMNGPSSSSSTSSTSEHYRNLASSSRPTATTGPAPAPPAPAPGGDDSVDDDVDDDDDDDDELQV